MTTPPGTPNTGGLPQSLKTNPSLLMIGVNPELPLLGSTIPSFVNGPPAPMRMFWNTGNVLPALNAVAQSTIANPLNFELTL